MLHSGCPTRAAVRRRSHCSNVRSRSIRSLRSLMRSWDWPTAGSANPSSPFKAPRRRISCDTAPASTKRSSSQRCTTGRSRATWPRRRRPSDSGDRPTRETSSRTACRRGSACRDPASTRSRLPPRSRQSCSIRTSRSLMRRWPMAISTSIASKRRPGRSSWPRSARLRSRI